MDLISRRSALTSLSAGGVFLTSSSAHAQIPFLELAHYLDQAADLIVKLSANIITATKNGFQEWDIVAARLERKKCQQLSKSLSGLYAKQNGLILIGFDNYIALWSQRRASQRKLKDRWVILQNDIGSVLEYVLRVSTELEKANLSFSATKTYRELLSSLEGRRSLLSELRRQPAPISDPDIRDLKVVAASFNKLHSSLGTFIDALNVYIAR